MSILDELRDSDDWIGPANRPDLNRLIQYVVDDIPPRELGRSNVILLLESPDIVEVCRRHPLAGKSGKGVTVALREILDIPDNVPNCPFGELLQYPLLDERLRNFGVMNVSQLPMQSSAYPCPVQRDFDTVLFNRFKRLRIPEAIRSNKNHARNRAIKQLLVTHLEARLQRTHQAAYIVPCGNVARAFFTLANVNRNRPPRDIPHPSFGQWQRRRNRANLNVLRQQIDAHLP